LLVFLVVLVLAWRWRNWRENRRNEEIPRSKPDAHPTNVVACLDCGLHVPARDAVSGTFGAYCCADHRANREP
jgi:uncharacterized protein